MNDQAEPGPHTRSAGDRRAPGAPGNADPSAPLILVPLFDGPPHSSALPIARTLAGIQHATLHVILIADPATPTATIIMRLGLAPEDLHGAVIDRAGHPFTTATLRLAERWPNAVIVLALSAEPGEPSHSLGAAIEEVITRSPGPVVLVPPARGLVPWHLRRILVPHDGTPTTAAAIGPAVALAARAGAELVILHVAQPATRRPGEPGTMTVPRYIDQPQHEWPAWAREFMDRLCAMATADIELIRTRLATGDPGREIARYVVEGEFDLVVIGWRGRLEGEKAATMKEVIREAGAPILILRAEA